LILELFRQCGGFCLILELFRQCGVFFIFYFIDNDHYNVMVFTYSTTFKYKIIQADIVTNLSVEQLRNEIV